MVGGESVIDHIFIMKEKPTITIKEGAPQLIISDALQMGDVLEQVLKYTGPATLTVSTFSSGEEFLRKLHRLRRDGLITCAELFTDFKAAEKTARTNTMLREVFDFVHFCKNHSKMLVAAGKDKVVSVISSQNQTRGNRLESYLIAEGTLYSSQNFAALSAHPIFDL